MTVVDTRLSVWEALAGRAPGNPVAPADPGLWSAVAERLNPARARPRLRPGIEESRLTSVRGVDYVMVRSPDQGDACYLRLTPEEWALAGLMDGTRTVARLVAEFAKLSGRLAPDQVTRVVADLAGGRMLEELPVDAFRRLDKVHRRPWPVRLGRGALAFARGRRLLAVRVDPLITFLYKAGGRLLFTRVATVLAALVAVAGLGLFGWTWLLGSQPVFLAGHSYALGALVLLGFNVLALSCHELGHALATKHAGRRVPAAGFLVYFGIPSVFVDTTDVWMAGRRARLRTTVAGPFTGLVLAGAAQLVAIADPALAPWCFKLSFAWYVNVAFNLNPFLALDGYYLLMDWIEVPNLRARGLAWILARLRRRPPAFKALDREGRLVAIYGMLSLVWLAIAANLAYRIYVDRVGGLITGLWRAGWAQRALVVAVILGLASPFVYAFAGWLAKRWRRGLARLGERRVAADAPRRYDALRGSALGRLPAAELTRLAADARWVRPRTGEQLVFAGAAQPSVFVVVDGALEGRRPGDPSGMVRERVGAGGVVGLASALTGAAAALAWHTAGTTLLAVPSSSVAAAVGPVSGPGPGERAELEWLFDTAPALTALSTEDRLGLLGRARPVNLAPGEGLVLPDPQDAAVVAAGTLTSLSGAEIRAGALVGPLGGSPSTVAGHARTQVRAWLLPAMAGLPLLLGAGGSTSSGSESRQRPRFGVHPPAEYPPLAAPPGVPPSTVDDRVDRRFERRLWWLLILLLLLALLFTGANLLPGPAWSEMPQDQALLHVSRGTVTATVDGRDYRLGAGDDIYVSARDSVVVGSRADARLTFRGGGYTVLCGGTRLRVGPLASGGRPIAPSGVLAVDEGKVLAYTAGTSPAFLPLALRLSAGGLQATNDGAAKYSVGWDGLSVAAGTVTRDGGVQPPSVGELSCGEGRLVPPPPASTSPSPSPTDSPSASGSPSASPSPSTSDSPTPTRTPTATPTTRASSRAPSPSPVSTNKPPTITFVNGGDPGGGTISWTYNNGSCSGQQTTVLYEVSVTDDHDGMTALSVVFSWNGSVLSGSKKMGIRATVFWTTLGPFAYGTDGKGQADKLAISVTATDSAGASTTITGKAVAVAQCVIIG